MNNIVNQLITYFDSIQRTFSDFQRKSMRLSKIVIKPTSISMNTGTELHIGNPRMLDENDIIKISHYTNKGTYINDELIPNNYIPQPLYLTITQIDLNSLLQILRNTNSYINSHKIHPSYLDNYSSHYLYQLSQCYNVILLQKYHSLELCLDQDVKCFQFHDTIQTSLQPFVADYYIKYESQNKKVDIRRRMLQSYYGLLMLPRVNILRYNSSIDDEYINLPSTFVMEKIQISNSGSELLQLTRSQYEQYVKIHPKYVYQHKYIYINNNNEVAINYFQYHIDHSTEKTKYYFRLIENCINIVYGQLDNTYCPLNEEIIKYFIDIKSATYTPTCLTNIMNEVEEVKQLILPLNVKLQVKFEY
jgi:hypothetical protein